MASLINFLINGFLLLQVLAYCTCDDASISRPEALVGADQIEGDNKDLGARQIFSPRMGKDVPADESHDTVEKLYARIPPLPKLGKAFDAYLNQYRREEDSAAAADDVNGDFDDEDENELQAAGDKRAVSMLRMGRRAGVSMLRMGKKSSANDDEYYRDQRAVSMLRMGRSNTGEEATNNGDDKRAVSMLRMGRRSGDDKRAVSMLRMGRSGSDKRAVSMLRMGRSQDGGKRAVSMLRMG